MVTPRELLSLYQQIKYSESQNKRKSRKENSKNNKQNSEIPLYQHLLNKWDKDKILKFMKAFLKKGRTLFEENLNFNPQVEKDRKITRQAHIKALNELEQARITGDINKQYQQIKLISEHYNP